MKYILKNNYKLIIGILIGLVISTTGVIAATILTGSEVSYTGGKVEGATNIQQAIDGLYDKANSSTSPCSRGYVKQNENGRVYECIAPSSSCSGDECKLCKRAESLHTETCNQTSNYCVADGYTTGSTITYGNETTTSGALNTGDAFDCDVNGDGIYDNMTERFYYVSTKNNGIETDENTAVLIYYNNTVGGVSSTSVSAWYSSTTDNSHGPETARSNLPTESQWNTRLTQTIRNITYNNNVVGVENFSYEGYAARLLTNQELKQGCFYNGQVLSGDLDNKCNFLMENTRYSNSNSPTFGPWLETMYSNDSKYAWAVDTDARTIRYFRTTETGLGARPAIEVQLSEIEY